MTRRCVIRLLLELALYAAAAAVSSARVCEDTGAAAPRATTLMKSPKNESEAWIVQPDCAVEVVAVEVDPDDRASLRLVCPEKRIVIVESVPTANRFFLDSNALTSGDFSKSKRIVHLILAYSEIKTLDEFEFSDGLDELDLEGNSIKVIAPGKIPETVTYLYLGFNKLTTLANISIPSALEYLALNQNKLTEIDFFLPASLEELVLDNNPIAKLEELVFPNALQKLQCVGCGLKTIRGVELPSALLQLNINDNPITEFEVRQSDLAILDNLNVFSAESTQSTCSDTTAELKTIQDVPVCVITDDRFEEKYPTRKVLTLVDTPAPTSTSALVTEVPSEPSQAPASSPQPVDTGDDPSSGSSSTLIIVISVVGGVLFLAIAVIGYRVFNQPPKRERGESGRKYRDAGMESTLELQAVTDSSDYSSQEYLSNDVRNDEELITFRVSQSDVEISNVIAKGGFGVIKLGTFRGRAVAVKQILPDKARNNAVIKSFMDEIRLCSKLDHPKMVEFVGISWSNLLDVSCITEYMSGGDMSTALRSQVTPTTRDWYYPSSVLKAKTGLALDVIEALVYLHSFASPIIHRDLKARNVLLNTDGDAKLSDFGISREVALDETMTGEIGTVAWIAPEVLQGERYSEQADIYSFGVLLVELDLARHPYSKEIGENGEPLSATAHTNTRIALLVSAGKLRPSTSRDCPPRVSALAARCLQYAAQDRPSAVEIHYELRKIQQATYAGRLV